MSPETTKSIRKFWRTVEAIHTVVYFTPEAKSAYKAIGLRGYWSGYFASRAAPLGTPGPDVVTATFYGFAPTMVAKAIPDAWDRADRDEILATRRILASRVLQGAIKDQDTVLDVANSLLVAADRISYAGRPLAAAHHGLPAPESPLDRLWHACSILREYRGDGHNAVLTAAGVGPVEANILQVAIGKAGDDQRTLRGWSKAEWEAGYDRLVARGWIDAEEGLTDAGLAGREEIEAFTDVASNDAVAHLIGTPVSEALLAWARAIIGSGVTPFPSATGTVSA